MIFNMLNQGIEQLANLDLGQILLKINAFSNNSSSPKFYGLPKDVMQGKSFQKCTHLLYCSVLSLSPKFK